MGLFGETSTTKTTTIPGRSGGETDILALLQQLAQQFGGQMGDLSQLAQGQAGGPTGQDMQLIADSIGRIADIANRENTRSSQLGQARLGETLSSRGVSGSSAESVQRALLETQLQDQTANTLDRARSEGSQTALQLPFQRAALQLSANSQLFNQLSAASNPILQHGLGERQAQQTTTETSQGGFGLQELIQLGGLAAAPFTGGASLGLSGGLGGLAGLFGKGGGINSNAGAASFLNSPILNFPSGVAGN